MWGIVLPCLSWAYPTRDLALVFMICFIWIQFYWKFVSSDLRKRQSGKKCITYDEGYKVAKDNQLPYAETSALTMDGLYELFEKVVSSLWIVNKYFSRTNFVRKFFLVKLKICL